MIRTRGRRPLACHHEAGHAVARWWLGFHVDDVTVLSVEDVLAGTTVPNRRGVEQRCEGLLNGYDIHSPYARDMLNGTWDDAGRRDAFALQAERRAVMALVELYAGAYAEARYLRRSASACFLSGGGADVDQAREIAAGWFDIEEEQRAAHVWAETLAKALVRSPKAWAAVQAVAAALLDRGRVDGNEVNALCAEAYAVPFVYDRWAECWPPSPTQIRGGFLPVRDARQAA